MSETIEYIFSINTGRSGSHYLASLMEHVADCCAFHEPEPIGNGEIMRRFARGDVESMRRFSETKVDAIRTAKGACKTYVETNHCFIKGFGWFIPEHIPEEKLGVVILKRDESSIVDSVLRTGYSPLMGKGREWISTPEIHSPLVSPPRKLLPPRAMYTFARFASVAIRLKESKKGAASAQNWRYPKWIAEYERECTRWYVEETRAKAEAFKRRFPRVTYYEANVDELNNLDSVRKLLATFGLTEKETLQAVVGRPTNLKLTVPGKRD
jgi:hypothetical protein